MKDVEKFFSYFENLEIRENDALPVAVSGGIDSLSLVIIANEWAKTKGARVVGITVNHNLRPSSREEADYVGRILAGYGIEHHILEWVGEKPASNIESKAREARYSLITDFCLGRGYSKILLGHHAMDQAETFLIRLFRGSGIQGLASMQPRTDRNGMEFLRPLLYAKKDDLRRFLEDNNIQWAEDETNESDRYLRNRIRHFLEELPDCNDVVNRINDTVRDMQMAKKLLDGAVDDFKRKYVYADEVSGHICVNRNALMLLEPYLATLVISDMLMEVGGGKYRPRLGDVQRIYNELSRQKMRRTLNGCIVEILGQNLCIGKE